MHSLLLTGIIGLCCDQNVRSSSSLKTTALSAPYLRFYNFISTALVFLFALGNLHGQSLSGQLKDESGKGIQYVNIYSKDLGRGTVSNKKGQYSLKLKPGTHSIIYSAVGFITVEKRLTVEAGRNYTIDVELKRETRQLPLVEIKSPRDRAKEIMDQVRKNRKYHLDLAEQHSYKVYRKSGVMQILKDSISRLAEPDTTRAKLDSTKPVYKQHRLLEHLEEVKVDGRRKSVLILAEKDHSKSYWQHGRSVNISVEVGEEDIAPIPRRTSYPYLLHSATQQEPIDLYKNTIELRMLYDKPVPSPLASGSGLNYKFMFVGKDSLEGKACYILECQSRFNGEPGYNGLLWIQDSTWALLKASLNLNSIVLKMARSYELELNYIHEVKSSALKTGSCSNSERSSWICPL